MSSVWPDVPAATSSDRKVRDQLDYIVWIAEVMEPAGFHGGADQDEWRRRAQTAYSALVDAMAPGHGDPLPPDVPPALRPGTWPDVPSAAVPGMTVRHQLAVVRSIAAASRTNRQFPHAPGDVAAWTSRVQAAFDALDHGHALAMPDSGRTAPPIPPAPTGARAAKVRRGKAASARGAKRGKASARKGGGKAGGSGAAGARDRAKRRRRG